MATRNWPMQPLLLSSLASSTLSRDSLFQTLDTPTVLSSLRCSQQSVSAPAQPGPHPQVVDQLQRCLPMQTGLQIDPSTNLTSVPSVATTGPQAAVDTIIVPPTSSLTGPQSIDQVTESVVWKNQPNLKKWFLTFPHSGTTTKEEALARLQIVLKGSLDGCLIAQELHADGTPHLHIGLWLKKAVKTTNSRFFDFVCGKHGNYLKMRSPAGTLEYLHKSDANPLSHGTIPSRAVKKRSKRNLDGKDSGGPRALKSTSIAEAIRSGASIRQIFEADPGYFLLHKGKIQDLHAFCAVSAMNESLTPWPLNMNYLGEDEATRTIAEWLKSNIKSTRPFRAPQLFISGAKKLYKTTMVELLRLSLRIYDIPMTEDFYDMYDDSLYDMCLMDEFKGQKTIQWMNLFLQGNTMNLRQKGHQVLKRRNLPVIILSNFTLEECYHKAVAVDPTKLDTLKSRFLEVHLLWRMDIKGLAEALGSQDSELMKNTTILPSCPDPVLPSDSGLTRSSRSSPSPPSPNVSSHSTEPVAKRARKVNLRRANASIDLSGQEMSWKFCPMCGHYPCACTGGIATVCYACSQPTNLCRCKEADD